MIIDFHTHTFPDKIAASTVQNLAKKSRTVPFSDGSVPGLLHSMEQAGVDYSVNLPVMTNPGQVEKINSGFLRMREEYLRQGIIPFGGIHPDDPDYKKEIRRLKENHIAGIKIHPAYQNMMLDDLRVLRVIECACEEGLIVVTHAGVDIGIYDRDYCSVPRIAKVIDTIHPDHLVLAHLGAWSEWEAFERDLAGAPVWIDTAFSIGPITPNPELEEPPIRSSNLDEEDFLRIVRKHGIERVLFATDSPWADQSDYVSRIRNMDLTQEEQQKILSGNAQRLLGWSS